MSETFFFFLKKIQLLKCQTKKDLIILEV
uniref:Uncharacterized protein n=1 Tax=Rhizophora mucronata TaxID=61149 RepID=A0A2P2Q2J4_RHIMU